MIKAQAVFKSTDEVSQNKYVMINHYCTHDYQNNSNFFWRDCFHIKYSEVVVLVRFVCVRTFY